MRGFSFDSFSLPLILLTAFAVLLQVQFNLFQDEYYTGLRIALSDIVIPFTGLAILYSLLRKKSHWPDWQLPYTYAWLAGLFSLLVLAALNTYYLYDVWSNWALMNKLPGFAVMVAYMALGGWIATNLCSEKVFQFTQTLCTFFFVILILQIYCMTLMIAYPPSTWFFIDLDLWFPLEGFMANRNAYALFTLISLCLLIGFDLSGKPLFPQRMTNIILFLLPFGLVDIGSRASFLALLILFVYLLFAYRKRTVRFLLPFLLGIIALTALYAHAPQKLGFVREQNHEIFQKASEIKTLKDTKEVRQDFTYQGDENRLSTLEEALIIFKDHELFGAGLGAALYHQKLEDGKYIALLDSTPLWLLIETGIAGLLIFSLFFLFCLHRLWLGRKDPLTFSIFLAFLCYGVMCVFHEMAYTRQIWFLLGMALCVPFIRKSPAR